LKVIKVLAATPGDFSIREAETLLLDQTCSTEGGKNLYRRSEKNFSGVFPK